MSSNERPGCPKCAAVPDDGSTPDAGHHGSVPTAPEAGELNWLAEIRHKCADAVDHLNALADDTSNPDEATRLALKAAGVALMADWLRAYPPIIPTPSGDVRELPEATDDLCIAIEDILIDVGAGQAPSIGTDRVIDALRSAGALRGGA